MDDLDDDSHKISTKNVAWSPDSKCLSQDSGGIPQVFSFPCFNYYKAAHECITFSTTNQGIAISYCLHLDIVRSVL